MAVNFYLATNDPRVKQFYDTNANGIYQGRAFGSSDVNQGNSVISGLGSGILQSPGMDAFLIPAFESLFMQAEAAQRGYISGRSLHFVQEGGDGIFQGIRCAGLCECSPDLLFPAQR